MEELFIVLKQTDMYPIFISAHTKESDAKLLARANAVSAEDYGYGTEYTILKQTYSKGSHHTTTKTIWSISNDGIMRAAK